LARLRNERTRTAFQLSSYADACERGNWLEVSIDAKHDENNKPLPGLRKMQVPLGPVVVFGASNFPFAYSTAGGDTACALAAGCPVIIKAHPAHAKTSDRVAEIILKTARSLEMPEGVFTHVHGGNETGKQLVKHPYTKAVGFTGSFEGGMALYNFANQRKDPIPVFAEMGSVNPVFILPGKLKEDAEGLAKNMAASITLGSGLRVKNWISLYHRSVIISGKQNPQLCCIPAFIKVMLKSGKQHFHSQKLKR
jgi:NADP-dependent aldehyde dehydrogenase